mmetsp:Transcript_114275/g.219896  ORF Transcript_114275/g.219896 Transcript_114275/m.219896 type:complete len:806 (+) Transcript_114275:83-2500(+)
MTDGEVFSTDYSKLRAPEIRKPVRLPVASDSDFEGQGVLDIVWFKRDLRIFDHEVLHRVAGRKSTVLLLYILEPDLWKGRDMSERQFLFLRDSMLDLDTQVKRHFGDSFLVLRVGDAVEILDDIVKALGFKKNSLWSHQETWNLWTYERDKRVKRWCRDMAVAWQEPSQHGVVRRLQSRNGWAEKWQQHMSITSFLKAPAIAPHRFQKLETDIWPGVTAPNYSDTLTLASRALETFDAAAQSHRTPGKVVLDDWWAADEGKHIPCPGRQRGGRDAAVCLLSTFLHRRGQWYQKEMSSPLSAWESCSRLSAHLAFGTLSLREVYQQVEVRQAELASMNESERPEGWALSLQAMSSRLRWHCHFIQKLEDEPELEYRNMHPAYDGLRTERMEDMTAEERRRLEAWKWGNTGYPMVDAVMRALIDTGWLNFRMRAMLVSFASFHLFLHWREPALWMAKLFVDYEPGIHFCQFQMQAGTTGMNTIRCYSPHKQAYDQDPDGVFIRRWVSELKYVPNQWIHEPHLIRDGLLPTKVRRPTKKKESAISATKTCSKSSGVVISEEEKQRDRTVIGVDRTYMLEDATSWRKTEPQKVAGAAFNNLVRNQYPNPIVEEKVARQFALDRIFALRRKRETIDMAHQVANKHGSRKPRSEENPQRFSSQVAGRLKGFGENLDKKRSRKSIVPVVTSGVLAGQTKLSFTTRGSSASAGSNAEMRVFDDCKPQNKKTGLHLQASLSDFLSDRASKRTRTRSDRTVESQLLHDGADATSGETVNIVDIESSSSCDYREDPAAQQDVIDLVSDLCSGDEHF